MTPQFNPGERFGQVEATLNQLANSQRHPLTAQVMMARLVMKDGLDRAEQAIQRLAEENTKLAEKTNVLTDKVNVVTDKVNVLIDIVQRWDERHGNGASGQQPA